MSPREELGQLIRSLERRAINPNEFWSAIYERSRTAWGTLGPYLREILDALLRLREGDVLADWDVRYGVDTYVSFFPEQQEEVLQTLLRSPIQGVRELVPWFQELFRCRAQSRDHDYLRRTSSLQPGRRLMLFGDRSGQRNPWWLNGREHYKATIVRFVGHEGSVPLAFVELDDELDMTSADGRRHQGRYALLHYYGPSGPYQTPSVAWQPEGTVTVHIMQQLPEDLTNEFYALNTGIESHAQYKVIEQAAEPAAAPDRGGP